MIRILNILFQIFRITLAIFFICLLCIHFIFKDTVPAISVLFYICPLPLIILFGCFVLLLFFKKKIVFYGLLIILLGNTIYFGFHYFGAENQNVTAATKCHILFWNASRTEPLTMDFLMDHITQSNPEIIALVEAENVTEEDMQVFRQTFPTYQFRILEGTMLIGVKGTIESIVFQSRADFCHFNYVSATIRNKPMTIMISDVIAVPLTNRKKSLGTLHDFTKNHHVDVLLGDFNTPYESAFFKPFKTEFKSFHPYSLGMTSTWPMPFPVIEIDHIWLAQNYNPIKLQKFSSNLSRHKLLLAEYQ